MDMDAHNQLETKAGLPPDTLVTHDEMMRVFDAFKNANDQRLATIEKRGGDVLLEEKVARINQTLDLGATIEVSPSTDIADDQWTLRRWNLDIAAYQAHGSLVFEKVEARPEDAP